eukprot:9368-Heterococcus_DN1.PRE.3
MSNKQSYQCNLAVRRIRSKRAQSSNDAICRTRSASTSCKVSAGEEQRVYCCISYYIDQQRDELASMSHTVPTLKHHDVCSTV